MIPLPLAKGEGREGEEDRSSLPHSPHQGRRKPSGFHSRANGNPGKGKSMEGKMRKRSWLFVGIIGLLLVSAACAPSRVAMDYGTSYNLNKFNQTLNPEAAKNLEPVTGLDGVAGQFIMDRYFKDFEKTSPPPVYMFTVGGGITK